MENGKLQTINCLIKARKSLADKKWGPPMPFALYEVDFCSNICTLKLKNRLTYSSYILTIRHQEISISKDSSCQP